MILSNVKDIIHNNKHLKNIKDSNGNIIWGGVEYKDVPTQRTLTVGSGQNITTTQYANRLVMPSNTVLRNNLASIEGVSTSSINNITIELDASSVYWVSNSSSTLYAFMSTSSGTSGTLINPSSANSSNASPKQWKSSGYYEVTKGGTYYGLSSAASTGSSPSTFYTSISSTGGSHFCKSNSATTLPTFTLRVSYTVNKLVDAYPYRKLDGIYLSGNEYIQLPNISYSTGTSEIWFKLDSIDPKKECCLGSYWSNYPNRSWEIYVYNRYIYFAGISIYANLQTNTWYRVVVTVANTTTNSAYTATLYSKGGSTLGNISGNLSNTYTINFTNYLGCRRNETTSPYRDEYYDGFLGECSLDNAQASYSDYQLVPCQRKSDHVCGMYDKVSSTFVPLQGTVVGDGAMGLVVDEYWDLT